MNVQMTEVNLPALLHLSSIQPVGNHQGWGMGGLGTDGPTKADEFSEKFQTDGIVHYVLGYVCKRYKIVHNQGSIIGITPHCPK